MDQCKALTELRADVEYSEVPLNIQRWTLKRLDEAYKRFFKFGGFPRFRSFQRWKSFGFAEFSGLTLKDNYLKSRIIPGKLRLNLHRPVSGKIKSCVFKKDTKGWYVFLQCIIPAKELTHAGPEIGIDVGLNSLATLSNGHHVENPRIARKYKKELRRRQRALSRCKKGSNGRRKAKISVSRLHDKIKNTRRSFLHEHSSKLVQAYSKIMVEDLQIRNMAKSTFGPSIHDASWGIFIEMLEYKVANTGSQVIKVNPHHTSQECCNCGKIVRKTIRERMHSCDYCGTILDRDHNAALNILSRGGIVPRMANVAHEGKRSSVKMSIRRHKSPRKGAVIPHNAAPMED